MNSGSFDQVIFIRVFQNDVKSPIDKQVLFEQSPIKELIP